ncbi:hypothetical protein MNBD_BACTEROID01-1619 [hydrothermal vent metagenome]|uniref:GxxExxY protein n=1 Tax=hydrothermal vent metagenome TaxID=652676 RepID=A0A3B0TE28_9ZZZZ
MRSQVAIPFYYDEIKFDQGFRLDILVDDLVIIEVKSVESLAKVHYKQLLTYLKLTNKKLGLLVNFYTDSISNSIKRVVNEL